MTGLAQWPQWLYEDEEKGLQLEPSGIVTAVRYGNDVTTLADVIERISNKEQGDDLPILMADLGCDYDQSCDAVFGGDYARALSLLTNRQPSLFLKTMIPHQGCTQQRAKT